jgi:hypothetical protein
VTLGSPLVGPGFAGWLWPRPYRRQRRGPCPWRVSERQSEDPVLACFGLHDKKAPGAAGAFSQNSNARSVRRDDRATPVEAVNQRGADGLNQRLEADGKAV